MTKTDVQAMPTSLYGGRKREGRDWWATCCRGRELRRIDVLTDRHAGQHVVRHVEVRTHLQPLDGRRQLEEGLRLHVSADGRLPERREIFEAGLLLRVEKRWPLALLSSSFSVSLSSRRRARLDGVSLNDGCSDERAELTEFLNEFDCLRLRSFKQTAQPL